MNRAANIRTGSLNHCRDEQGSKHQDWFIIPLQRSTGQQTSGLVHYIIAGINRAANIRTGSLYHCRYHQGSKHQDWFIKTIAEMNRATNIRTGSLNHGRDQQGSKHQDWFIKPLQRSLQLCLPMHQWSPLQLARTSIPNLFF